IIVSIGMWLERFVIIAISLTKDFLPSSWADYVSTFWDWALYLGSFGLFSTLFFLFIRLLPAIATAETKETAYHESHGVSDAFQDIRADYYSEPLTVEVKS